MTELPTVDEVADFALLIDDGEGWKTGLSFVVSAELTENEGERGVDMNGKVETKAGLELRVRFFFAFHGGPNAYDLNSGGTLCIPT